jgi:hypothetical protein
MEISGHVQQGLVRGAERDAEMGCETDIKEEKIETEIRDI